MSLDRSLKTGGSLIQHRSVLTRTERIAKMVTDGKYDPEKNSTPLGLPKMISRKAAGGKKKAKGPEEEATKEA